MKQIFERIINLPVLKITEEESQELAQLIHDYDIANADKLKKVLTNPETVLSKNLKHQTTNILHYANIWFEITNSLSEAHKKLVEIWNRDSKDELSTDDLLDIALAFLPDDLNFLSKLLVPLKAACDFSFRGQPAILLTNIYSATFVKEEYLRLKKPLSINERSKKIVTTFFQQEKIANLKQITQEYLVYLANLFKITLQKSDDLSFTYYFKNQDDAEKVLQLVIDEINEKNDILPNESKTLEIIYKSQTVVHMLEVFSYEQLSIEKQLGLFTLKFAEFKGLLQKHTHREEQHLIQKLENELISKSSLNWYDFQRLIPTVFLEIPNVAGFVNKLNPSNTFKNSFNFFTNKLVFKKPTEPERELHFLDEGCMRKTG